MTPHELAKVGLEHSHQKALFAWANNAALYGIAYADNDLSYVLATREGLAFELGPYKPFPKLKRLFAVHNQGHGDAVRGARAKAEGVKAGVPDVCLPIVIDSYAGLFIELKRPKKGVVSTKQDDWCDYLNDEGYQAHVCVGWEAARDCIKRYIWPLI